MAFPDSEERAAIQPWNLIICGPGDGQTEQYASAIHDAVHMLLSACRPPERRPANAAEKTSLSQASSRFPPNRRTCQGGVLPPGCVIPAGGTFEFLLSRALLRHGRKHAGDADTDASVASKLLAEALLTVPRRIYSHSRRQFLRAQDRILNCIQARSHPLVSVGDLDCCGATGTSSDIFTEELGLESVTCKHQLLLAVAQCASQLLRVDAVLRTHTALHAESHRLSNVSSEGKECEADD